MSEDFEKSIPFWLRTWVPIYRESMSVEGTVWQVAIRSTLSQTRGMGTPPPLVVYQSKAKFLTLISAEPEKLSEETESLARIGLRNAIASFPDHIFSGLLTKARITLTTSACWEKTRQEGGSLQAVGDIVDSMKNGRKAKIIDLWDCKLISEKSGDEIEIGEYIFWRCLEEVLTSPPEEVSKVWAIVVKEPGKGRTVTKGMVSLKIVLDVISKICSYPLKKVPTSKSGMSMDAHGWNLFQDCFQYQDVVFSQIRDGSSPVQRSLEGIDTRTYEDAFAECTDFENATDFMHHEIAWIFAKTWMDKCGIPHVLQRIVKKATFSERYVYFRRSGIFSEIGTSIPGTIDGYVMLKRGVMMGDPLTKALLHLTNISSRSLGRYIGGGKYKELIADNPVHVHEEYVDTGIIPTITESTRRFRDERPLAPPFTSVQMDTPIPRFVPRELAEPARKCLEKGRIRGDSINSGRLIMVLERDVFDLVFIPKKSVPVSLRQKLRKAYTAKGLFGLKFDERLFDAEDMHFRIQGFREASTEQVNDYLYGNEQRIRTVTTENDPTALIRTTGPVLAPRPNRSIWSWLLSSRQ